MSSKVTVTGRPGPIQKQHQYVAFTMKTQTSPANLPKGLPTLKGETKYMILVTEKQWNKVEKQINDDKEDKLYIEGFSTVQPDFPGIIVLAQTINTAGLMRARKEQQKNQSQNQGK
jgi:acyl-CoA reductase-like NAD-dependent aldehyde dehydrogenase